MRWREQRRLFHESIAIVPIYIGSIFTKRHYSVVPTRMCYSASHFATHRLEIQCI